MEKRLKNLARSHLFEVVVTDSITRASVVTDSCNISVVQTYQCIQKLSKIKYITAYDLISIIAAP